MKTHKTETHETERNSDTDITQAEQHFSPFFTGLIYVGIKTTKA